MTTIHYWGPLAIPSEHTPLSQERANTKIYDGVIPISSEVNDSDIPIKAFIYVPPGRVSPSQGLYFINARVSTPNFLPAGVTPAAMQHNNGKTSSDGDPKLINHDLAVVHLSVNGVCSWFLLHHVLLTFGVYYRSRSLSRLISTSNLPASLKLMGILSVRPPQ
jgi:hypothetical protein